MTTTKQPLKTLPGVITKSKWLPPRMLVYGSPGIGKSTLGLGAPDPIFIPTEPGVENVDVARFPVAKTLDAFLESVRMVADGEHDYKAVVIDTLNGLMELYYKAKKDIPGEPGRDGKTRPLYDFIGFGGHSGWNGVARDIKADLLEPLEHCQQRGMYVIMLAHTGTHNHKNPLGDDVVKTGPSINKWVWEVIQGWLDVIGRAEYVYSTSRVTDKLAKASTDVEIVDGLRVKQRRLYFDGGLEMDAKARIGYELPPEMSLSWEEFTLRLGNIDKLVEEIRGLLEYIPDDKIPGTLAWLGIPDLDHLKDAPRHTLSQFRNRLLERKGTSPAPPSTPSVVTAGADVQQDQIVMESVVHQ